VAANQADRVRDCLKPVRDRLLDVFLPVPPRPDGPRPVSPPPETPKRQVTFYEGIDFDGDDLTRWMPGYSLSACIEACQTNPNCKAFSFNRQKGACMLKVGFTKPTNFRGAVSGVMDGPRPPGH
jgi:hypothetical protein